MTDKFNVNDTVRYGNRVGIITGKLAKGYFSVDNGDIVDGNKLAPVNDRSSSIYPEFEDFKQILEFGAKKYGEGNWLNANGNKSSFKQMHDSMFHHLAESFAGCRADAESGLDPLLHLITRAQMMYTRLQRGITHKEDK